uniref:Cystatin-B n=1 Tax=Nothobranchius furzeri TaxID=105023 RepID=A0A8C6PLY8_NOTFU
DPFLVNGTLRMFLHPSHVKSEAEEKAGTNYAVFKAMSYKTQCAAGTNFLIKVRNGDDHAHLCVWEKLPCYGGDFQLSNIQQFKTQADPIEYF